MKTRIRYLCFLVCSAVLLAAPLLLWRTDSAMALSGVTVMAELPPVTVSSLMSGEFQSVFSEYIEQNMPGRPLMVRIRNQLAFSLFESTPNSNYRMNRHQNIFSAGNIDSYLQYREPVTEAETEELVGNLKRLNALLEANGRQMYLFITPCKARYYAEDIPWVSRVMAPEQKPGNYEQLMAQLPESGLAYFDAVAYIDTHSFDPRVPLFYNTSYHWSVYVGNCVGAAFGDYLEEKSGFNLPEIEVSAQPCEEPVFPDADVGAVFNLLSDPKETYYAPVITVTDPGTDAPDVFFRGGSFMGQSLVAMITNGYFGKDVYMENAQLFTDRLGHLEEVHDYGEMDLAALMFQAYLTAFRNSWNIFFRSSTQMLPTAITAEV